MINFNEKIYKSIAELRACPDFQSATVKYHQDQIKFREFELSTEEIMDILVHEFNKNVDEVLEMTDKEVIKLIEEYMRKNDLWDKF